MMSTISPAVGVLSGRPRLRISMARSDGRCACYGAPGRRSWHSLRPEGRKHVLASMTSANVGRSRFRSRSIGLSGLGGAEGESRRSATSEGAPHHEVDELRGVGQCHWRRRQAHLAIPMAEYDRRGVRVPGRAQVLVAASHVGKKDTIGGGIYATS